MLSDDTSAALTVLQVLRLNAPFGARCFLTNFDGNFVGVQEDSVLMHLLALGAF